MPTAHDEFSPGGLSNSRTQFSSDSSSGQNRSSLLRIPSESDSDDLDLNGETGFQRGISPCSANSEFSAVSASKRRVSESLARDFIRAQSEVQQALTMKLRINRFRNSLAFSNFMALIIFADAYANCCDIDARAAGTELPLWLTIMSEVCLGIYTAEFLLSVFFDGWAMCCDRLKVLDALLVACGYIELLLNALLPGNVFSSLSVIRILRLVRILRLLKILRKVKALRELQKLIKMLNTCLKALFWSFCFCFLVMTVWAMLIVESVHPFVQDFPDESFSDCNYCEFATSSVMHANLLLFKTVIAGDGWGELAVPVILAAPETSIVFIGAYLTIVFGVLNLIVAVVVDQFAEARERDVLNLAEELDHDMRTDRTRLKKMFDRIDKDGEGQLSLEQLMSGARNDAELQSRLKVMDIDEGDLHELFQMIDVDGSGTIELEEFIRPLSRWVHDSKTAPRFIKYNLLRTMHQQEELHKHVEIAFVNVNSKIDSVAADLKKITRLYTANTRSVYRAGEHRAGAASSGEDFVEQPHSSKPVTLKEVSPDDSLEMAVERLRKIVLKSTEAALEGSAAMMESLLRESVRTELRRTASEAVPSRGPSIAPSILTTQESMFDNSLSDAMPESGPRDGPQGTISVSLFAEKDRVNPPPWQGGKADVAMSEHVNRLAGFDRRCQLLKYSGQRINGLGVTSGRGRQVIATARSADMILMVLDATKDDAQRQLLTKELNDVGIRLNKARPKISVTKTKTGGFKFNATCTLTEEVCDSFCCTGPIRPLFRYGNGGTVASAFGFRGRFSRPDKNSSTSAAYDELVSLILVVSNAAAIHSAENDVGK
ncbi:Developmentally-regulated G-protein 1 [Symbiodinium microadriaticum]|uniref:Developmentally-regulated G-protein 1 n=1 Tax=Symbiodinium microadriaticum TaxID=2951 RepID=A0A1Q9C1S0_SYMMI|nr:Developmentally-regulated G-protein 1 [Symbiodinium microadriaticum]